MKKLLPLILLLTMASTGFSWPFGKPKPKPTPTPTQVEVPATPKAGRGLIDQLKKDLKDALEANRKLKISLDKAKTELDTARGETVIVQKKADELQEWGIVQQADKEKFKNKYEETAAKYKRLKLIAAAIAAAVGVLIGLQFMNFAPPPYSFAVPVGAAVLFALLVWMFF